MTLLHTIQNFPDQLTWAPVISNGSQADAPYDEILVCGMGGSGIAARVITSLFPNIPLRYHQGYGLPASFPHTGTKHPLIVLSSYSGNTEETIDALEHALQKNIPVAVVASGGVLTERARELSLPYIVLPEVSQPRYAIGYSLMSVLALVGYENVLPDAGAYAFSLEENDKKAKEIQEFIGESIPLYWGSHITSAQAYIWKIFTNESAKRPAFTNIIPELNHNELVGFEKLTSGDPQSKTFSVVMFQDSEDHPREALRMQKTKEVLEDRGLRVAIISFEGVTKVERLVNAMQVAMLATYYLAEEFGIDPEPIEIVEDFKKRL